MIFINMISEVEKCSPNPCCHGAECSILMEGYSCNCTDTGFSGKNCDRGMIYKYSVVTTSGTVSGTVTFIKFTVFHTILYAIIIT